MNKPLDTNQDNAELVGPVEFGKALRKISARNNPTEAEKISKLLSREQFDMLLRCYNTINPTPWTAPAWTTSPTPGQIKQARETAMNMIDPKILDIPWLWVIELSEITKEQLSALVTIAKPFQQALIQALKTKP